MALILSGCDLATPYKAPGFFFNTAKAQTEAPVLLNNSAWWTGLHDPALDVLVTRALKENISLKIARERVIAARAARAAVPGAAVLSSSAGVRLEGDDAGNSNGRGTGNIGLNWVLDPYGTRRDELKIADAQIDISRLGVDAAQLMVLFNLSNAYVELRHAEQVLTLSRRELASRKNTLALTQRQLRADAATRLEEMRSQARVAEIRAELPRLKAAVTARQNEIAVLTGTSPHDLSRELGQTLARNSGQPMPRLAPSVGIPTDLLRNRPDIQIAERRYYAAVKSIGVARADLYPRLSLAGAISLNVLRAGSGTEYYFGPTVQFPNLPVGQNRATVKLRHSEARQAYDTWRSTVMTAILEVENALTGYKASANSIGSAREARRLYVEARTLTDNVFRLGEATLGDLIDVQEDVSRADRTLADITRQHALQFIELNVRLGAGHAVNQG